ncbi:hypothetical protein ACFL1J_03150 [Pseudomonadota bacterium]
MVTVTTDGSGQGVFSTVLTGGNPYPGKYVHFDLLGNGNYTSVTQDEIFPDSSSSTTAAASSSSSESVGETGDPTDK